MKAAALSPLEMEFTVLTTVDGRFAGKKPLEDENGKLTLRAYSAGRSFTVRQELFAGCMGFIVS
ncbi:hypothetical protein WOA01_16770 [Methylocystis sp. IM2]|uniref:hypothetical protein n=1 Tax=Methylocystis sp. IM2 TaxID=3136563 RepID=UPI0030F8A703